jgi:hypothetical protein
MLGSFCCEVFLTNEEFPNYLASLFYSVLNRKILPRSQEGSPVLHSGKLGTTGTSCSGNYGFAVCSDLCAISSTDVHPHQKSHGRGGSPRPPANANICKQNSISSPNAL